MKMTISDVAREAGVSRATVSRVINGVPNVNAETVALIRQTMERMGYVRPAIRPGPKPRLQHPSRLRTGAIALVTIGGSGDLFQEPTMAAVIEEIQRACRHRHLNLLLDQMTTPEQMPLCVQTRRVDGVLLMVAGRPPKMRECIRKLADMVPVVHFFAPGHPVAGVDHVSVNDVALGALAYHTLKDAGCQSYVLVTRWEEFLEALLVRGRAFIDRAGLDGAPVKVFASPMAGAKPERFWPCDLVQIAVRGEIADLPVDNLPGPVGVFVTHEASARAVHHALEKRGLLTSGAAQLVVAGSTPHYVSGLHPAPRLLSLDIPGIISLAVDRLIQRAVNLPRGAMTFLTSPQLLS
ncbi:MAG: LacI family DNA-binding transcriptional regulator [Chthoniobacterales bacterium]|nr:LacI family DNA-binding transcriptional regulator [Chthoniobacterales bacterium]